MFPSKNEEESRIVRAGIGKAIEACVAMSIPMLLIPNFVKSDIIGKQQFDEAVEAFKWACDVAGRHKITVALENTLSTTETLEMIKQVSRPNLKVYFDTQNYYLHKGYNSPKMLDELMEHVCQIHVKDGKGKDLSGALLGQGDTNFYGCIDVAKKHGYTRWIVSENYYDRKPLSERNPDTAALIREDLRILEDALA
jgi:sugar phosphate isomerase/epimerase